MNYQFLPTGTLFAVAATYVDLINVQTALQGYSIVGSEIPWNDVIAGRGGSSLGMSPDALPVEVVDIDGEGRKGVGPVVSYDKCGGSRGRIVAKGDGVELRAQIRVHHEVQRGGGGIILHIPRAEEQAMLAILECGDHKGHLAGGIAAEVVFIVGVEVVGSTLLAVDDEL